MEDIKKQLLDQTYKKWIATCMGTRGYSDLADFTIPNVMGYGTTIDEKINGIASLRQLIDTQREQGKDFKIDFEAKEVNRHYGPDGNYAVMVDEIAVRIETDTGNNNFSVRLTTVVEFYNDAWKMVHWHGSVAVKSEGDTWHNEEYKRKNMELQKLVDEKTSELKKSLEELQQTQEQLIHSEKMAGLGELTAGIAHEIQNPLNFINNFSEINTELLQELSEEIKAGNYKDAGELAGDIMENENKINHHGKRADSIVKGMLQHSRKSNGIREPTDINMLCDEYLRLAYHGLRAKNKSFNARLETDFDGELKNVNLVQQDIGRVILNLITNAFYTVNEKKKTAGAAFEPTVAVNTKKRSDKIEISVVDNGAGIPEDTIKKIFQPFFTTKPTGEGTGLGLSMSYDIIKAHGGSLKVESVKNNGSKFIIELPVT